MSTPNHVAIIMDGNRRWARKKFLPDASGHAYGAKNVRSAVEFCINKKISFLTLFAFSTENWHRSDSEVSFLMKLFIKFLRSELNAMIEEGVHLQIIGDRSRFSAALLEQIDLSEKASAGNSKLTLTIAANYGGRWDIVNALNKHIDAHKDQAIPPLTEDHLSQHCISNVPNVDLMIRTGGEYRISNFLLWQAAYAELYFTDKLWPEFTPADFDNALEWYSQRERRFGKN